ncbi:MAG TPA: bifunctional phosphopantothenoylcysteine decarboxylase/phosphopantothenate--cysteine ligase CoaBC, partial [Thermoanaerobaculia bacterium]|nr:bifunctional phosphopantothenoylcysteine decarboxylase/phosphopantothenate--cysteine ligase CoaBC [Thermoanaerobaculia bacterium]
MDRPPRVLFGVSGGIAAYKAVEAVRELVRRGAEVRVAMTRGAREFVAPLTFAALSKNEVFTEVWGSGNSPAVDHVEAAQWADLFVVAPASAHTLGKLALGLGDDFVSTAFLAFRGPVLLAPAMETAMWQQPAVAENLTRLRARGARTVGPESGPLASGREGTGRMAEPAAIAEEAWRLATGRRADLSGLRLLVTAGPTREPLDPIRFVSNRSSGRMGFALAEAARDRGARVVLAAGPTGVRPPDGVSVVRFDTADDLHAILVREFPECDGIAMAAAVSDFIPESSPTRLHRAGGARTVRLEPGRDLLASLAPLR